MGAPRNKRKQAETAEREVSPPEQPDDVDAGATALAAAGAELDAATDTLSADPPPDTVSAELAGDVIARRVACPLCGTDGALTQSPRQSERYTTCPECEGHGEVLSGSFVPEAFLLPCESCSSRGYIANPEYRAMVEQGNGARFPTPDPPIAPAPGMEWDSALGMWAYPRRPLTV